MCPPGNAAKAGGVVNGEFDPRALGYYEAHPGSGIWRHPDTTDSREVAVCENPACPRQGEPFMRVKRTNRLQRFCSGKCRPQSQRQELVTYRSAHSRMTHTLGNANQYPCVDGCGRQAREWSYDGCDPGELVVPDGERLSGLRYSLDPGHYGPRCKHCHAAHDGTPLGEDHGQAKLTVAKVRAIRASVDENGDPTSSRILAETFGVSRATILEARNRTTWKHVA
jgi:hypothetical protein